MINVNLVICENCNNELIYSAFHDSYYCPQCNEWAEDVCEDEHCEFCKERPRKPI